MAHIFSADKWVYELNQIAVFYLNILRFGLSISGIIAGYAANDNNCPNAAESSEPECIKDYWNYIGIVETKCGEDTKAGWEVNIDTDC